MHEILDHLPPEAAVLDLASGGGSFNPSAYSFSTVRADLSPKPHGGASFVQADATQLPFRAATFDAVICNHGLEHFRNPERAMAEFGRVVKPRGALFVSVPDASTFHDWLYRFVYHGGGHINAFTDADRVARDIEAYSGLRRLAIKRLHAGFAFLNRRNLPGPLPRRYRVFMRHWELPLVLLSCVLRYADRLFRTRLSVYGWALYFGRSGEPVDPKPWTNVCVRCGQAQESPWIETTGAMCRFWLIFPAYRCPGCGALNIYTRDRR